MKKDDRTVILMPRHYEIKQREFNICYVYKLVELLIAEERPTESCQSETLDVLKPGKNTSTAALSTIEALTEPQIKNHGQYCI